MELQIVEGGLHQRDQLLRLYQAVAAIPGGLIRQPAEVTPAYIEEFTSESVSHGLMLVAMEGEELVGDIHAHTPPIYAFSHLLTDLTIMVHPEHQGKGIGRKLFNAFLARVEKDYPHILRVELYVRRHNTKNVQFYTSLGFETEGVHERKIFAGNGRFETPLQMVWINPGYRG
ncbi:GNAT family N-acetyltransferase [Pseudoflavitalea sp. G-6-1-2]|uniref:GNAT family N-acetyltransferase n=1 Tax=Pseudoflavitalea sp. G-6-1-2 TaxID=2728841 RepID=UPI00146B81FE|nr:GNAT family N-acetyltransferase [Pseudoflavitalea sp. G-6-1-2]NML23512.1 GNAT family N-acetyltransferase [Pseudoflavitalea sp. G-6-1-2]